MNKLVGFVFLAVMTIVGLAVYWYLNPHKMPRFIRDSVPGLELPSARSPMTNFRPPQF